MVKFASVHAALNTINRSRRRMKLIELRFCQYLNNIVVQDHRGVERRLRPMMGLKTFATAAATIARIELTHVLRKGQGPSTWSGFSMSERFARLAA